MLSHTTLISHSIPLLEMYHDRGAVSEFCAVVRELAIPGALTETTVSSLGAIVAEADIDILTSQPLYHIS